MTTYEGGEVVSRFTTKLLLVPEAHDVLHVGYQMIWVGLENDVYEKRHERVRGLVGL